MKIPTSVFLAGLLGATLSCGAAQPAKPNILIILADDLGEMDMGFNNPHTFYETPNLDRLARQGVRFTDAYAACPVCSPSRYAIQTGKYPTRGGLTDYLPGSVLNEKERFRAAELTQQMALSEVTLAEALKPAGYETAFIGKWHLGGEPIYWPEHQGYDVNIAGCSKGSPGPGGYFSPYHNPRLPDGPVGQYLPERLAGEAVKLLEHYKAEGKPFFLCFCDYLVHTPLMAPKGLIAKYEEKAKEEGIDPHGTFGREVQYDQGDLRRFGGPIRRVRLDQSLPVYAAMVQGLDTAAGRILVKLDELGLADNTLVIFTSDNGGLSTMPGYATSNLPYRGGKGWVYEGGIREPFVVRWPGRLPAGAIRSTPVIGLDIYPTLLEAAGVPVPEGVHLDGRSVLPAARGEPVSARDLFWHYPHYAPQGGFPGAAIRSGDLKLVEDLENGQVWLYNLKDDPGEQHDLAAAQPDDAARLQARLSAWQQETGAKFLRAQPGGPEPWHPAWYHPTIETAQAAPAKIILEPWQSSALDD